MKPKLGFSIESLVGGGCRSPPPLSDGGRETANSPDDTRNSPSPLSFLPKSFLGLQQEKPSCIQRPQPINAVSHQRTTHDGELPLPAVLQAVKGMSTMHNPLFAHSPLGLGSLPHLQGIPLPPQLNPLMMGSGTLPGIGSAMPREYPLYPWILSRHGRVFPQGLPSPEQLAYLLQPFRKPKRIRTAFSPSQLLKLEQAFEKNQYVVGAERKQLAVTLDLSETQVKVWFQNRRTKEKRIQQDGDEGESGTNKHLDDDLIDEEEEEEDDIEEAKRNKEGRRTIDDTRRLSDDDIEEEMNKRRKILEKSETKIHFPSPTASPEMTSPSSCHSSSMYFSSSMTMQRNAMSHCSSSNSISTSSLIPSIDSVILAKAIIGQAKNNFPNILTDDRNAIDGRIKNIESVN